jgi:hypothetical protein
MFHFAETVLPHFRRRLAGPLKLGFITAQVKISDFFDNF